MTKENDTQFESCQVDEIPSFWDFLEEKLKEDKETIGFIVKNPIVFLEWVGEDIALIWKKISKTKK